MKISNIWRINLKPSAEENIDPREFCLSNGCVGVGWGIGSRVQPTWEEYENEAKVIYPEDRGWWPALNVIKHRMFENDICWTRDSRGVYYIGRITGSWEYKFTDEYQKADIINTRKCEWLKVGNEDAVPGKVVNSFMPSRTVQAIDDNAVRLFSVMYYNQKSSLPEKYRIERREIDLFSLLSSEDCEDLVAIYMQLQGYLLLPSTCKKSTMAHEFIMNHRENNKKASAQVKKGNVDLDINEYKGRFSETFLFTTNGNYLGDAAKDVICISKKEMLQFIDKNYQVLPERIKTWIQFKNKSM